ncbi:MAG: sigma factor-like helix-turn-helix DNA-binding protein [Patescibacteria group bacterium]|nr:MAG: sigma factor-like helix-turn-helix DNA-binding protein [Patescibacteria group bacterium]
MPARSEVKTEFGNSAVNAKQLLQAGIHVVRPKFGKEDQSFRTLDDKVTFVHVDGAPMLWAVELVLERAPNLQTFQVLPSMHRRLHPDSALKLLAERGVAVQTGHVRPELAWEPGRIISKTYEPQRQFLLRLEGEQRTLFEELVAMRWDSALMTARYFCLDGEEYIPQRELCPMFGLAPILEHAISAYINGILYYLDGGFPANKRSRQMAAMLKRRVEKLRPLLKSAEQRQALAKELGLAALPANLPLARLDVLKELVAARRDGRLRALASSSQANFGRAIELRFGLDGSVPSTYRTLEEVGEEMGGITRERARQLEERALEILGISEI